MKKLKSKKELVRYDDQDEGQKEFLELYEVYNEKGQALISEQFDCEGNTMSRIVTDYDESGEVEKLVVALPEGKITKTFVRGNGREEITITNEKGAIVGREMLLLNGHQRPKEYLQLTNTGELLEKLSMEYNEHGAITFERNYDEENQLISTHENQYNEEQQLIYQSFKDEYVHVGWEFHYEGSEETELITRKYVVQSDDLIRGKYDGEYLDDGKDEFPRLHEITVATFDDEKRPLSVKIISDSGFPNVPIDVSEITRVFEYTFWEK